MPKKDRYNRHSQENAKSGLPVELLYITDRATRAVHSLLDFCGPGLSSSDDDEPRRGIFANIPQTVYYPGTQKIDKTSADKLLAEHAAKRQPIAEESQAELLRVEALLCATTEKQALFQRAQTERNMQFSQHLFSKHSRGALTVEAQETQERADIDMIFKDDKAVVESSASKPSLFKPAPKEASKQSWGTWAMGFVRRS